MNIEELLGRMHEEGASDLHIKVGSPPSFRKDGAIVPIEGAEDLNPDSCRSLAYELMSNGHREVFERRHDVDFGYSAPGMARFRVNIFQQRGSVSVILRRIPIDTPDIEELGLPEICKDFALMSRGLVLIAGPGGSGKSTALAAMVQYINQHSHGHILTIEDPIEFLHRDGTCLINQREVGSDTESCAEALRRALREDADIIVVSDMYDPDVIRLSIRAAETGRLVLGGFHATGAVETIERIVDAFPSGQKEQARSQLSSVLQGVVVQVLVPKAGGGRAPAHEILVATPTVRRTLWEATPSQLRGLIQGGKRERMRTLEDSLAWLVRGEEITLEDAIAAANRPEELHRMRESLTGDD